MFTTVTNFRFFCHT